MHPPTAENKVSSMLSLKASQSTQRTSRALVSSVAACVLDLIAMLACAYARATSLEFSIGYCTDIRFIITTQPLRVSRAAYPLMSKVSPGRSFVGTHIMAGMLSTSLCLLITFSMLQYVTDFYVTLCKSRYVMYRYVTMLLCMLCLLFDKYHKRSQSPEFIVDTLRTSRDVKLQTMLSILSLQLPATSPCPSHTVQFRRQVSNFLQVTRQQMEQTYMAESVEGCQAMCDEYHFSSNFRRNVTREEMIFLTNASDISTGDGADKTFHLVLSCRALLENVRCTVPYPAVCTRPADDGSIIGPAQVHLDETHKVLLNRFPLFAVGHANVQQR